MAVSCESLTTADRAYLGAKMLRAQATIVARGRPSTLTAAQLARLADVLESCVEDVREMDRLEGEVVS